MTGSMTHYRDDPSHCKPNSRHWNACQPNFLCYSIKYLKGKREKETNRTKPNNNSKKQHSTKVCPNPGGLSPCRPRGWNSLQHSLPLFPHLYSLKCLPFSGNSRPDKAAKMRQLSFFTGKAKFWLSSNSSKVKIKLFPTIWNANPPHSLEACTRCPSLGPCSVFHQNHMWRPSSQG